MEVKNDPKPELIGPLDQPLSPDQLVASRIEVFLKQGLHLCRGCERFVDDVDSEKRLLGDPVLNPGLHHVQHPLDHLDASIHVQLVAPGELERSRQWLEVMLVIVLAKTVYNKANLGIFLVAITADRFVGWLILTP